MRRCVPRALLASWLTALVAPAAAYAQQPASAASSTDAPSAAYDAAVAEGLQHFAAARWPEAYAAFAHADFERPGARTQRGMGMAAFNLGWFAKARAHLEAALDAAAQPLTDAQREHVQQLLGQTRTRTGRYVVRTDPGSAQLEVDGRSSQERLLLLDVGTHELVLLADGYASLHRTLAVRGGEDEVLELGLRSEAGRLVPVAPTPLAAPAAAPAAAPEPDARAALDLARSPARASAPPWGPIVLGVSGAVLAAALVTGLVEQAKEGDLDALCPDRACQPEHGRRARSLASAIDTLQVTTDVLLLTGLAGAGLGAWLWLSDDDAEGMGARAYLGERKGELGLSLRARAAW